MVRRYLSGELIRGLSEVEKYWRPGFSDLAQRGSSGHTTGARLFGPGRAPPEEDPDFYTFRFRTRGAILGAEGGMFKLERQMIVLRDEAFLIGLFRLRSEGLCCAECAEHGVRYRAHSGYLGFDPEYGDYEANEGRCILGELLEPSAFPNLWVSHADAVVKIAGIPDEYIRIALTLFDLASYYEAPPRWVPSYQQIEEKPRRRVKRKKPTP